MFLHLLSPKIRILLEKKRIFGGSEDVLAGSHNFKGLFEGSELVLLSG